MSFGWKILLPLATLNLLVTAIVVAIGCRRKEANDDPPTTPAPT